MTTTASCNLTQSGFIPFNPCLVLDNINTILLTMVESSSSSLPP